MALSPTEESLVRQLIAQNPALLNLASSESTIISKLGATKVSLSDLSAATSLSDADLALVRQGLNDKSFALSILSDYVNGKLPAASETVAGVVEIATAAEAQAFTADKAIDGAKLADAFAGGNQGLTSNGYQKLPGGLIMQWGSGTAATGGVITFPIAFPTQALSIGLADGAASDSDINMHMIAYSSATGLTKTGFTIFFRDRLGNAGATSAFSYIAIGY